MDNICLHSCSQAFRFIMFGRSRFPGGASNKQYCTPNIGKILKLNSPPSLTHSSMNPKAIESGPALPSQTTNLSEICQIPSRKGISGDGFINDNSLDKKTRACMEQQMDQLKESVRGAFTSTKSSLSHQLKLIDDVQRLGVAYHFETEIEEALENIHVQFHDVDLDLYNESLRFRLLRQHGYNISSDVFIKFKDAKDGSFKESLIADVLGMLSLYEATHLRVHGEEILDEALAFTTHHLELAISQVCFPLTAQISQALERPIWRCTERSIATRNYISMYQATTSHEEALLKLAKLDFNLVQSLYKEELSEVTTWWKEQDIERNIPFARHRIVECFLGMVGICFEPQYSVARKIGAKLSAMATMLDDIFDTYATLEELKIFREAMERWDVNYCMDGLPQYMVAYYHSLLNMMNEIEEELDKQGELGVDCQFKNQARDYLVEAKWLHEGCTPSMEEYMAVRVRCIGTCLTIVISLVGISNGITKETFEWVLKYPKIVWASSLIFRLMDDIDGSKCEKAKGDVASSIECYMQKYGISEEETINEFNKQIVASWKDINEELLKPTAAPKYVLKHVLNLSRIIDMFYKGEDGFTYVGKIIKQDVTALFGDPMSL